VAGQSESRKRAIHSEGWVGRTVNYAHGRKIGPESICARFARTIRYQSGLLHRDALSEGGAYDGRTNTLYLSHGAVRDLKLTKVEVHEKLHALFRFFDHQGILSPFHTEFRTESKGVPIVQTDTYGAGFRGEEVAGYALSLSVEASRLKQASLHGAHALEAAELKEYAKVGHDLTQRTYEISAQALEKMRNDPAAVETNVREVENRSGIKSRNFYYSVKVNGVELTVPGVSMARAGDLQKVVMAEVAAGTLPKEKALPELQQRLRLEAERNLEKLNKISGDCLAAYAELENLLDSNPVLTPALVFRISELTNQINRGVNSQLPKMPKS
jgi:hypothetical protein